VGVGEFGLVVGSTNGKVGTFESLDSDFFLTLNWITWNPNKDLWYAASDQMFFNKSSNECNDGCIEIYTSADGQSWTALEGLAEGFVARFSKPTYMEGLAIFFTSYDNNFYISQDAITWQSTFDTDYWNLNSINSAYQTSDGENIILTGTGSDIDMLFQSSDGENWERIMTKNEPMFFTNVYPVTDTLFLGLTSIGSLMWYSEDAGVTWSNSSLKMVPSFYSGSGGNVWISNGNNLCFVGFNLTCAPISSEIIYESSWTSINPFNGTFPTDLLPLLSFPVILNSHFVVAAKNSATSLIATSPTGVNTTWTVTPSNIAQEVYSFDSNQMTIIGIGPNGLITSASFS